MVVYDSFREKKRKLNLKFFVCVPVYEIVVNAAMDYATSCQKSSVVEQHRFKNIRSTSTSLCS